MARWIWIALFATAGCAGDKDGGADLAASDTGAVSDSDTDADADSDTDVDTDTDTDTDTDSDTDADTGQASSLPGCGDLSCDGGGGEDCVTCPTDCGACNPSCDNDGTCEHDQGENCISCGDCDTSANVCGNGECQGAEDDVTCQADCGPAAWPTAWLDIEDEIVVEMNAYRAAGTDCPSGPKSPAAALTLDPTLQVASQLHSWDQSLSDYFDHESCNGRDFWDRAGAVGGSASAEVITWNASSASSIVGLWITSTYGHCDAVMNGSYTAVGPGYADVGVPIGTALFR